MTQIIYTEFLVPRKNTYQSSNITDTKTTISSSEPSPGQSVSDALSRMTLKEKRHRFERFTQDAQLDESHLGAVGGHDPEPPEALTTEPREQKADISVRTP